MEWRHCSKILSTQSGRQQQEEETRDGGERYCMIICAGKSQKITSTSSQCEVKWGSPPRGCCTWMLSFCWRWRLLIMVEASYVCITFYNSGYRRSQTEHNTTHKSTAWQLDELSVRHRRWEIVKDVWSESTTYKQYNAFKNIAIINTMLLLWLDIDCNYIITIWIYIGFLCGRFSTVICIIASSKSIRM